MSTYFLAVDGIGGTSVVRGFEGALEVIGFDVSATRTVSVAPGGGGNPTAGPPQITVAFANEAGLTAFLDAMEHRALIGGMTLTGVDNTGAGTVQDYVLKLGKVAVTSVHDGDVQGYSVTLTPGGYELTTRPLSGGGVPGSPQVSSWFAGSPVPVGATVREKAITAPSADKFYLVIDGLHGGSTAAGHEGAFELNGFSFDGQGGAQTANQTGKPTFSAVSLNMSLGTVSDITKLLGATASGDVLKGARIEGVSTAGGGKPVTVYSLELANVQISNVHESGGGGIPSLSLDLGYEAFRLDTSGTTVGGLLETKTDLWDLLKANDTGPGKGASTPATTGPDAPTPNGYFMLLNTTNGVIGGDTQAAGWQHTISVAGYTLDVSGAHPTLTIVLGGPGLAPELIGLQTGRLTGLTLDTVAANGGGAGTLEQRIETSAGVVTNVSIQNGGAELTVEFASLRVLNYDNAGKHTDVTFGDPQLITDLPGGPPAKDGLLGVDKLYIALDGVAGDAVATGHADWFSLEGFQFSGLQAAQNNGQGLEGSVPQFSAQATFSSLDALVAFMGRLQKGSGFTGATIEGVQTGAKTAVTTFQIKLGEVYSTGISQSASGFTVDLVFGGFRVESFGVDDKGATHTRTVTSWDAAAHTVEFTPPPVAPANGPDVSTIVAPTDYFLTVPGVKGSSVTAGFEGTFKVTVPSLTAEETVVLGPPGHAQVSKPVVSPLTVHFEDNAGLSAFLNQMNAGGHYSSISLVGRETVNGTPKTAYAADYSNAIISSIVQDADGQGFSVSFKFTVFDATTNSFRADGTVANTGTTGDLAPTATKPGGAVTPGTPTHFYLLVDGLNGGATAQGHEGWFDLQGFSFGGGVSITSTGGGTTAGPPQYDQVQLGLSTLSGLPGLLAKLMNGGSISGVRIEGVDSQGRAVYDLNLVQVTVAGLDHGSSGSESLTLAYTGYQLKTVNLDKAGNPTSSDIASWNLLNGNSTVSLPNIAPGTLPPGAPIGLSLDATADSGLVGDLLTNAQSVLIDGYAQSGATIKLFDNGTEIASGTANGSGVFQVAATTLGDGPHALTAVAVSGGLSSQASAGITVTVDRTAPTAPTGLTLDPTPATDPHALVIDGKAEAGSKVVILDGATQVATATADANGTFRATTSVLSSGVHTLTATATDAAGNKGPAGSLSVNLTDATSVAGGAGDDVIAGSDASQKLVGGGGNDTLAGGAGNDTLSGDAGNDLVLGGTGNDSILGADGNDTVDGGAGPDVLAGGRGTDVFVFGAGSGSDMIIDFRQVDHDQIRLVGLGATSMADVTSHAVQVGSNVVITFGTDVLQINGIQLASLTASDFLFA